MNIETDFKLKRTSNEIEGISFCYGKICFKGSEIDRKFSYANLQKEFQKNIEMQENNEKRLKEIQNKLNEAEQKMKKNPHQLNRTSLYRE